MTKTLKWRLGKLPTSDEVRELVKASLITKEEARDILFNQEEVTERDKESLEAEIKFLREIIEKLSNRNQIVETVRYIEKPYFQYHWYKPYEIWCSASDQSGLATFNYTTSANNQLNAQTQSAFTSISTF